MGKCIQFEHDKFENWKDESSNQKNMLWQNLSWNTIKPYNRKKKKKSAYLFLKVQDKIREIIVCPLPILMHFTYRASLLFTWQTWL